MPMLDLLYAAANEGTGRRAALAVPTFGKTGTTQDNNDAVFVGFAGDLVVGVWIGRDDNQSLGKVSGGTVPAEMWHNSWPRRWPSTAVAARRFRRDLAGSQTSRRQSGRAAQEPAAAGMEQWHEAAPGACKQERFRNCSIRSDHRTRAA